VFRAQEKYFMLNRLEKEEGTASIFRVDVILTLKIEADRLKFFGGPLVACEQHVW
jgi:hypothetical protein